MCPNLVEFICSADADWNWQTPDWIAPAHPPPHAPHLRLIGIRDIDHQLLNDASFFPLVVLLSSFLRQNTFPKLQFVRDLSRESDGMRKGGRADGRGRGEGVEVLGEGAVEV